MKTPDWLKLGKKMIRPFMTYFITISYTGTVFYTMYTGKTVDNAGLLALATICLGGWFAARWHEKKSGTHDE